MYLKRKIDIYLNEWKNDKNKKPLIVRGARQTGKTSSIRKFAKENYESIVEINFVIEPKYKTIISNSFNAADVIKNISRIDPSKKFINGKTLIFFDEITEFPDIATTLKSFSEDGRFDVICSGSMLGINYKKIHHNSVGYKTDYNMYSMDFEEFLWAKGYDDKDILDMLTHMEEMRPFSEAEMKTFHALFVDYCILGGMPAVVSSYIENDTFEGSIEIQRQLIEDYKEDIRKYAEGLDQGRIINVFNGIAPQLSKENKKFQLSKLESGARFKDYRGCTEWLSDAGIINVCYCLDFPELPLKGNFDVDRYKIYFSDTGLLVSTLDEESADDLRANCNLGVYKGALYENSVGEALVKSGYDLYYYKREDSTLEEDFFIRSKLSLVPIEVKSRTGRSKSLRTLIDSDKYMDVKYGFKLSYANIGYSEKIYTFPYFCSFLIKRFMKTFSPVEEC